jgi:hypothetical protein
MAQNTYNKTNFGNGAALTISFCLMATAFSLQRMVALHAGHPTRSQHVTKVSDHTTKSKIASDKNLNYTYDFYGDKYGFLAECTFAGATI